MTDSRDKRLYILRCMRDGTGQVAWGQIMKGFESQGKCGLDLMWKEMGAMNNFHQGNRVTVATGSWYESFRST